MVEQVLNAKRTVTASAAPSAKPAEAAPAPAGDRLSLSAKVSTLGDKLVKGAAEALPWAPSWLQRFFNRYLSILEDMREENRKDDERRLARVKQEDAQRNRQANKA
jgi:hypothetical protein